MEVSKLCFLTSKLWQIYLLNSHSLWSFKNIFPCRFNFDKRLPTLYILFCSYCPVGRYSKTNSLTLWRGSDWCSCKALMIKSQQNVSLNGLFLEYSASLPVDCANAFDIIRWGFRPSIKRSLRSLFVASLEIGRCFWTRSRRTAVVKSMLVSFLPSKNIFGVHRRVHWQEKALTKFS